MNDVFSILLSDMGKVLYNYYHNNFDVALSIIARAEKHPSLQVIAFITTIKAPILVEQGKAGEAKTCIENALEKIGNEINPDSFSNHIRTLVEGVRISSLTGDRILADNYLSNIQNVLKRFKLWWISAYLNVALSFYESAFGDTKKAKELMANAATQFQNHDFNVIYGTLMYELALLYHRDKEQEKCNRAIDSALEIFTPLNFTLYIEKCLQLKELLKA